MGADGVSDFVLMDERIIGAQGNRMDVPDRATDMPRPAEPDMAHDHDMPGHVADDGDMPGDHDMPKDDDGPTDDGGPKPGDSEPDPVNPPVAPPVEPRDPVVPSEDVVEPDTPIQDHGGGNSGTGSVIGQTGEVALTSHALKAGWVQVSFDAPIENAVVVAGPPSRNGQQPVVIETRNVSETGFEIRMKEWDYLDNYHTSETVGWMAIEAGRHEFGDGRVIEAGSNSIGGQGSKISFSKDFDEEPIVLAQAMSTSAARPVTDRIEAVSDAEFRVSFQTEEKYGTTEGGRLDWIAVSDMTSTGDGILTGIGDKRVGHESEKVTFAQPMGDDFVFLADMQTMNGTDPSTTRLHRLKDDFAVVSVQEERSRDDELSHWGREEIGYVAIKTGLIHDSDWAM
jgi:hypothetical protein